MLMHGILKMISSINAISPQVDESMFGLAEIKLGDRKGRLWPSTYIISGLLFDKKVYISAKITSISM